MKLAENKTEAIQFEWESNLKAYQEDLGSLDSLTAQLHITIHDVDFQTEIKTLRNNIFLHKKVIAELLKEQQTLIALLKEKSRMRALTLSDLIEKNRLREKVRKAEQTVFVLKYRVNKLLTVAS
jgi:hypothetical protein